MSCCPTDRVSASSSIPPRSSATGFAKALGIVPIFAQQEDDQPVRGIRAMVKFSRWMAASAASLALGLAGNAFAQATVKVGAVYPLSGNAASAGNYEKMAIELAAEVVNSGNAELAKILPFISATGGLPGLKGAKVQVVVADNQGTPAAGANQTLRLITQEKVAAVIGA